ncbi:hypothetical protein NLX62_00275 [Mycobacteriaceae bacterium Msp059]|nr:hypothetical protein [Mycobacteriaceae bacterium Msp059]
MTEPDPWAEPVDLDAAPDWEPAAWVDHDAPPMQRHYEDVPVVVTNGDDAAFWRDATASTPADTHTDTNAYADWIAEERRVAFTVACPVCKVVVDQPCIRVYGNPPQPVNPPEPIRKYPAHAPRLRAARRKTTTR